MLMENRKKRLFGRVLEVSAVTGLSGVASLSFKMHINYERFGYATDFNQIMMNRDIGVVLVGSEVVNVSKKLVPGMFCEVYGQFLDVKTLDMPSLDDEMITNYMLTDNIAIHFHKDKI